MKELVATSIGRELLERGAGQPVRNRLEFDPASGQLRLRPQAEHPSVDVTPVDQIASDGFA
jgi:hypothetical protein